MPISNVLSDEARTEIRQLHEAGMPEYKIAAKFDVSPNTIRWHIGKRTTKRPAARPATEPR